MRILIISAEMPFPPIGGGLLRTYHWLEALSRKHKVTLVAFTFGDAPHEPPPFPAKIIGVPWQTPSLYRDMESENPCVAKRAFETLRDKVPEPWYASYFESAAAMDVLRHVGKDIDLVLIEDSDMGRFIPALPAMVPKILDFHNVYTLIAERAAQRKSGIELGPAQRERDRTARFEAAAAAQCMLCLTCSEREADAARTLLGVSSVATLPNGVDTTFFTPAAHQPQPGYLLFTGSMDYPPNIEAVEYFATRVLPLVQQHLPGAIFHIVGTKPGERVHRLRSESVIVHGRVPDVRPYFAGAELFVAPILSGGGTRLKILEAAASGKAIITTSLGAEGLGFSPREDLVIADSPALFSREIINFVGNKSRIFELGQNARRASLAYDWDKLAERLYEFVESVIQAVPLAH